MTWAQILALLVPLGIHFLAMVPVFKNWFPN